MGHFCTKLSSLFIFRELEQNIAFPQNKCLDEAMKFDLCNADENIPQQDLPNKLHLVCLSSGRTVRPKNTRVTLVQIRETVPLELGSAGSSNASTKARRTVL